MRDRPTYLPDPQGHSLHHRTVKREWIPVQGQTNDHTAMLAGVPLREFYTDASAFVSAQISVQSYYGFDSVVFSNDVYNIEAEALGATLVYDTHRMPCVDIQDPLIKEPSDLGKLKPPDFAQDGRFPYQLEIFRQKRDMGLNQASFCGPASLAVALRTYQRFISDLKCNPAFAQELMAFLIGAVTMPYVEHIHRELGITEFRGSDAVATVPLFAPETLKTVILPWNLEVIKRGHDMGVNAYVYSPGIYGEQVPETVDEGLVRSCYDFSLASMGKRNMRLCISRKPEDSLDVFLAYALDLKSRHPEVPLTIQIGLYASLLREGPLERIIYYIKKMLDTFAPTFAVSIAIAGISPETPPEHIHAAVQSAHYYGQLPYRFIDDDAAFKPTPRESYVEFVEAVGHEEKPKSCGS